MITNSGRPAQRALQTALRNATSNLKGFATLFGVMVSLATAYYAFANTLKLQEPWPAAICTSFLIAFALLYVFPELLYEIREKKLVDEGIHGRLLDHRFFRLAAYEVDDANSFQRPDGAAADVCRWIQAAPQFILCLWGNSGVGKSSLINAAIVPAMKAENWIVLLLRPHDSPLNEIATALLRPSEIWQKPPAAPVALRDLIDRAAQRVQKDGKRLLLIVDQFEEVFTLCSIETKNALASLLLSLNKKPLTGIKILLSLRTEYLSDLPALGLEKLVLGSGENNFEVRPFSKADAQHFMEKSNLDLGPELLNQVLEEAAEIEDMPDRVRPIVLNLFGMYLSKFTGSLPEGVHGGRLLTSYIEGILKSRRTQGFAINVIRPMVLNTGTKRALTLEQIAEQARVAPEAALGCLTVLANDGLVRRLQGNSEKWEVAHDFVAKLLHPLIRSWRRSAWERTRPFVIPITLAVWLMALSGLIFLYPWLHDEYILSELRTVGLVPGAPTSGGNEIIENDAPISDAVHFWKVASRIQYLYRPVARLTLGVQVTSLQGMPTLPGLTSLDLSNTGITTLQGMPTFPALTWLDLRHLGITNLQGMPMLPALRSLILLDTGISSLEGMPMLPALTSLKFGNGFISYESAGLGSLEGMPNLPALQSLEFDGFSVDSLKGLPILPALTSLTLANDDNLTALDSLPALPALASLDLTSDSRLDTLKGMPILPALKYLTLSNDDNLSTLEGMPILSGLTSLDLSEDDNLSTLEGMPVLPALTSLYLEGETNLYDLRGMPSLPALTSLSLKFSDSTSLEGMPLLPRLITIDVEGSLPRDLKLISQLPALKTIKVSIGQGIDTSKLSAALKAKVVEENDGISLESLPPQVRSNFGRRCRDAYRGARRE